ncbi:D-aminoacyl-tRNA deacylase [Methanofollis fontis]|uniref:D-aminoacyl-tRNA deacylase n=1 Tax=Methanofollis fontis TaxID=2052832 RepID=A0A483CR81_9EURY|nr:D-aminoacyl-tRNA deacylase [Methanofollis fontis]TAJ43463.1 D-tyrosyl-tRNA(Tyr) deacylase [Methanofollis fontis]
MHVALLFSRTDPGGSNIAARVGTLLSERDDWPLCRAAKVTLRGIDSRLIYAEGADRGLDADLLVFLSRHSSARPVPALTVHVTGNFGEAAFGGDPECIAPAAPAMMHAVLRNLAAHAPPGYRVSYEATHHGPTTLSTPSLFVEIGSTETEWRDPAAADAAALAVLSAVPGDVIPLVGFGGTHYAVRQTEIALSSRGAFGHIAPTHAVPSLGPAMVGAMVRQSGAVAGYIDRKALRREDVRRIEEYLQNEGLEVLSEGEITDIRALSWASYAEVRRRAGDLLPGGRVRTGGLAGSGPLTVVELPPSLVSEAERADPGRFREVLSQVRAASVAGENGTVPSFITFNYQTEEVIHDLISLCIKIIDDRWSTAAAGDDLVITRTRFDPSRARELGVPKGPLFGALSAGRTVEVDGRTITPSMVQSCSETRIHIPGLERYTA